MFHLITRFSKDIKVVHFIGAVKPWHYFYDRHTGRLDLDKKLQDGQQYISNYLLRWWETYTTATDKLPAGVSTVAICG